MDEIITEFQSESEMLVGQMLELLESIEGEPSQVKRLAQYGQYVDRMMGTSKSLALAVPERQAQFSTIGTYCEICKQVGYKGSQITQNEELYNVVVALLLDATEMLQSMISALGVQTVDLKSFLSETFLDRLLWVTQQFAPEVRGTVASVSKADLTHLLRSLGVKMKS